MTTNSPNHVSHIEMWDSLGNNARADVYHCGISIFEVYTTEYCSVPIRFVGTLSECNARVDIWLAARKSEGFSLIDNTDEIHAWKA